MQKLHSSWGACVWAGLPPGGHVTGRAHPNRGTRPNNVFVLFIKGQPPFDTEGVPEHVYIVEYRQLW